MRATVTMEGVREYCEDLPVKLEYELEDKYSSVPKGGRWVISALNESGHNSTQVDLLDLIKWLRESRPDLLRNQEKEK